MFDIHHGQPICIRPCPGGCRKEAWILRRCLTIFNSIVRRPHWPREPKIQELIQKLGIKLPPRAVGHGSESEEEDDDLEEEDCESESCTDDEEVQVSSYLHSHYLILLGCF
jgi:hypothetical protein